jgi:hypothetical protein
MGADHKRAFGFVGHSGFSSATVVELSYIIPIARSEDDGC